MRSFRFSLRIAELCSVLLLICAGRPPASNGQTHTHNGIQGYGHQTWQAPEGLPQDSVQTILQTRDGFLWVGTEHGLARFDGLNFDIFNSENDGGIRLSSIETLYQTRDSTLWIGTRENGLVSMSNGKFTQHPATIVSGREDITAIQEAPDGSLWIGFRTGGLGHLNHGHLTVLTTTEGLSSNKITALLSDVEGTLWVATEDAGLNRWDGRRFTVLNTKNGLPGTTISSLYQDADGSLWIGTNHGVARLKSAKITTYSTRGLANASVLSLHADRDGNLWIGTDGGGLNRLKDGAITVFNSEMGLSNNVVLSIAEDAEGGIWIGTDGGGLNRLKKIIFSTSGRESGLRDSYVQTVAGDGSGGLWIGTNAGLSHWKNGVFSNFSFTLSMKDNAVRSLFLDHQKALWIGTDGGGAARLKDGTLKFFGTKTGWPSDVIMAFTEDVKNHLWIGTTHGLVELDGNTTQTHTTQDGLPSNVILALVAAPDGSLWMGTSRGLSHWSGSKFVSYGAANGFTNEAVSAVHLDSDGTVWIGTEGAGLFRLKNSNFTSYTTKDGLADDVVPGLMESDQGDLWLPSNRGLTRISKTELDNFPAGNIHKVHALEYGIANGMKTSICTSGGQPAAWKAADGILYFATIEGLARVDPAHLHLNLIPPPAVIERVAANSRSFCTSDTHRSQRNCAFTAAQLYFPAVRQYGAQQMNSICGMTLALAVLFVFAPAAKAQDAVAKTPEVSNSEPERPMVLTEAIPLEGVKGRFDHFATSGKLLFVSALGNNTVEVIGISSRTLEHTITGVPNPQGVAYAPEVNKLFVASSKGKLYIYDGTSFDLLTSIDFHGDVDNLRYDAAKRRLYVGYGDEEEAAIGAVDVTTDKRLDEIYKLGAHPESFQLESSGPHIYVNLPDLKQVAVIDRTNGAIARWPLTVEHNFPMALDEADHRLFIATHEPARLAVIDTNTGHLIAALPSVQDADDLYFDAGRKRIYMAGGEGFIYVFQQNNPDQYQLLAKITTALGARTAGYFGKGKKNFERFFLAVPARADHGAEIWIYTVQD